MSAVLWILAAILGLVLLCAFTAVWDGNRTERKKSLHISLPFNDQFNPDGSHLSENMKEEHNE